MAPSRPGDGAAENAAKTRIRLSDLSQRKSHTFLLIPDADLCAAIAADLDLIALRKLRLEGTLTPAGKQDWDLAAQLGATVVQPCVATLAPVTTRIEEKVQRGYRADLPEDDDATEVEMHLDETLEPLPDTIDLEELVTEALALALPAYPRVDGTQPDKTVFTEPGKTAMTDEDARPFAGLAGLKDKLVGDGSGNSGDV
ncbi:DUF177 domain-containing protein [Rhodobacteraceae bacterium SC52]|nr:DUF177 domain-containing protein [Rhodobacteraceae bacterium SC52]